MQIKLSWHHRQLWDRRPERTKQVIVSEGELGAFCKPELISDVQGTRNMCGYVRGWRKRAGRQAVHTWCVNGQEAGPNSLRWVEMLVLRVAVGEAEDATA